MSQQPDDDGFIEVTNKKTTKKKQTNENPFGSSSKATQAKVNRREESEVKYFKRGDILAGSSWNPFRTKEGPFHATGNGSKNIPTVCWEFDYKQSSLINQETAALTEKVCREAAQKEDLKCIVIRGISHNTTLKRDEDGHGAAVGPDGKKQTEPDDPHITVWAGNNPKEIYLGGHIYVKSGKDFRGNDTLQIMTAPETERVYVKKGTPKKSIVFWWKYFSGAGATHDHTKASTKRASKP
ncbi:hypothetical protein B0H63DRAFT_525939 [Podospora didyma]|uniref:Uncharacterized protein n=1 Tax=Podospora didyma TaxID=330526 RepID=A0AAE0KER2_9PEZI|nr:hypothetical protein B0H63DRAFT_525939 [Podospora didyma]